MKQFTIESNNYLSQNIEAYYHCDYMGGGRYKMSGTMEYAIFALKGDAWWCSNKDIEVAKECIGEILAAEIAAIVELHKDKHFTVCATPRSKAFVAPSMKRLLYTIQNVVDSMDFVDNGVEYIRRVKNTYTTHKRSFNGGGDGPEPYPGITIDTCAISDDVRGKDIILIDDIYTSGVNIDEDAIEALLQKGAKSVVFYAIGRTVKKYNQ